MGWLFAIPTSIAILLILSGPALILSDRDLRSPQPERLVEGYHRLRGPFTLRIRTLLSIAFFLYVQVNFLIVGVRIIFGLDPYGSQPLGAVDFLGLLVPLFFLFIALLLFIVAIQLRFSWVEYNDSEVRRHTIFAKNHIRISLDRPDRLRVVVTNTIDLIDGERRIVVSTKIAGTIAYLAMLEEKGIHRQVFH